MRVTSVTPAVRRNVRVGSYVALNHGFSQRRPPGGAQSTCPHPGIDAVRAQTGSVRRRMRRSDAARPRGFE